MTQCPLLEQCLKQTGMDCSTRNFDGKQTVSDVRWLKKEPCMFYKNLMKEREHHPHFVDHRKKKKQSFLRLKHL